MIAHLHHVPPSGLTNYFAGFGLFLCACIVLGGYLHDCTWIRWKAAIQRREPEYTA